MAHVSTSAHKDKISAGFEVLVLAKICRHKRISVLLKQVRYQAAPRPDDSLGNAFAEENLVDYGLWFVGGRPIVSAVEDGYFTRTTDFRLGDAHGVFDLELGQIGAADFGAPEIRAVQLGGAESGAGQIRAAQIGAG